jgi:diaminopimelate decarboxylase
MHVQAIEVCAGLLAAARREKLGPLDTLDIGGGFPIDSSIRWPTSAVCARPSARRCGHCRRACA